MLTVTITRADQQGVREAGRLVWDGVRIGVQPTTEADRPVLMAMLRDPILIVVDGEPVEVTKATPERFLRNLCREYTGSYLRASKPE